MRKADLDDVVHAAAEASIAAESSPDIPSSAQTPPAWALKLRTYLDPVFTPSLREKIARAASAVIIGLSTTGTMTSDKAALWSQLGLSVLAMMLALIYADSNVRARIYGVVAIGGSVLGAYGIANGVAWAVIIASMSQAFGITTAAAKAQIPEPSASG